MKTLTFSTILTGNSAARCNARISSLRHTSGLSYITTLAGRAKRLLPVFAAVILLVAMSKVGWAQPPDVVANVGPLVGSCNDSADCCQWIMIIANQQTETVNLNLEGDINDNCVNTTCWADQSTSDYTCTSSGGTFTVTFSPTSPEDRFGGPWPDTAYVRLCAPDTCWEHFPNIEWNIDDYTSDRGTIQTENCIDLSYSTCGNCDRVTTYDNGCSSEICFHHFYDSPMGKFKLHFDPPLRPCNYDNPIPPFGGSAKCPNITGGLQLDPGESHWSWSVGNGDSDLTFSLGSDSLYTEWPGCFDFCFSLAQCAPPHSTVVTVRDGFECADGGISLFGNTNLKKADGSGAGAVSGGSEQNYPNPVDASSGFNTTIPFTTTALGTAFIRIVDANGKVVLKYNQEVTYSGTHFFYFTAADLPSGTYYYQIEFPKGVVIQNKTMIVVK